MEKKISYWERRRHSLYYRAVFQIASGVGQDAKSIIDVGSANTDYILWFDWIPKKVQLNKGFGKTLPPPGVQRISADFFGWEPDAPYDVVLCLQVLEHLDEPEAFCTRLKNTGKHLVVSVPYKWKGTNRNHVQDPVDEVKLERWMGRKPNYWMTVTEPFGPTRMIAYYDVEGGPKSSSFSKANAKKAILEAYNRSSTKGSSGRS